MAIKIDDNFINTTIQVLTDLDAGFTSWSGLGPNPHSGQSLNDLEIWAGTENFHAGSLYRNAVLAQGKEIGKRLLQFQQTSTAFITALRELQAISGHIEDLNSVSAADFTKYLPSPPKT